MTEPCSLKPCPFCGSEDLGHKSSMYCCTVICRKCGASLQTPNGEGAYNLWNTRTPPRAQMEVERYRDVLLKLTRPYSGNPDDPTLDEIIAAAKAALQPAASEG